MNSDQQQKTIALVIYSDPKMFPPTVHAANILSEKGWKVYLVGVRYDKAVEQIHIHPQINLVYSSSHATGIRNLLNYIKLCFDLVMLAARKKVDVLMGYDSMAAFPVFLAAFLANKKWVYHQHDYFEFPKTIFQKFIRYAEHKLSRFASFTVFPQIERAELFASKNHPEKKPLIVFNGPRKDWMHTQHEMYPEIAEMHKRFRYLLIYQGSLARMFGVENLINAVAECKSDVGVIILGKELERGIKEEYKRRINQLGIAEKFQFLNFVPYHEIASITSFCDIGIAKLTNDHPAAPINDRFLIGASNKITEYIACGLPVITSVSVANKSFLDKFPIGYMCDVENATEFAGLIDAVLNDEQKLDYMKQHNKKLFGATLNYDSQFEKCAVQLNII